MGAPSTDGKKGGWYALAHHPLAGVTLMAVAALAALIWANSPWASSYESILSTHLTIGLDGLRLDKPLRLWICLLYTSPSPRDA